MKGTIIDAYDKIRTREYIHNAALVPGDSILVNGSLMVAINTTDANKGNVFLYRGKVTLPKAADKVLNVNDPCYLDEAAGKITSASEGNTRIGTCDAYAAAAATEVDVMVAEN